MVGAFAGGGRRRPGEGRGGSAAAASRGLKTAPVSGRDTSHHRGGFRSSGRNGGQGLHTWKLLSPGDTVALPGRGRDNIHPRAAGDRPQVRGRGGSLPVRPHLQPRGGPRVSFPTPGPPAPPCPPQPRPLPWPSPSASEPLRAEPPARSRRLTCAERLRAVSPWPLCAPSAAATPQVRAPLPTRPPPAGPPPTPTAPPRTCPGAGLPVSKSALSSTPLTTPAGLFPGSRHSLRCVFQQGPVPRHVRPAVTNFDLL